MIVTVAESEYLYQIPVRSNHQIITVLGYDTALIRSENSCHIHLPYPLTSRSHTLYNQNEILVQNRENNCSATICMYENTDGFDCYERYDSQSVISVSDSHNGQIHVGGQSEDPKLCILTDEMRMEVMNDHVACNRKIIHHSCQLRDGDLISFRDLRMIVIGSYVFINTCSDIRIYLKKSSVNCNTEQQNCRYKELQPAVSLDLPIETKLRIQLPQPDLQPSFSKERPLILTMGPALMMSLASLSAGILSAWRAWMQGRELPDILPVILFPCIMVLSTVIWNPAARLYEKKRHKAERQKALFSYQSDLAKLKEEIRIQDRKYKELAEQRFPYPDKLASLYLHSTVHEIHSADEKLLLRTGDRNNAYAVIPECSRKETDHDYLEMTEEFCRSLQKSTPEPWLVDLKQYAVINVMTGKRQNDFFLYLILQLYWVYGMHMAFLLKNSDHENCVWIRKLAAWDDEKRMIFHEENEALNACMKNGLVLVSDSPVQKRKDGVLCIMKGDDTDLHSSLLIDPDQEYYSDLLNHMSGPFSFTIAAPFDADRILERIPYQIHSEERENGFLSMFGCEKAEDLETEKRWKQNDINTSLCAYLGTDNQGNTILLDLNEKKDGPHGLIAGMTGSGKSELIITMLLSLAVNYSPEDVQFAIIDFKGGGISQAIGTGIYALPHIAGILTNLDTEDMERALVSFHQECIRRERLIAEMNRISKDPVMNLQDYRKNLPVHHHLPYLSELIIVIDEFAELKRERPEFLRDLISIARIGRSLGVHLILSTQKPGGSVSDEIWTNCSFKICLRVSQPQDSFEMLHQKDACNLHQCGSFILLSNGRMRKGRAAYANMRHSLNPCRVIIHDETGKCLKDSVSYEKAGPPEIIAILHEIHKSAVNCHKSHSLWLAPMKSQTVTSAPYGKRIFAQYDDYRHHSQPWLSLPVNGSVLFVSTDPDEKKKLLNTLFYTSFSAMKKNDELFLIDDIGIPTKQWEKIPMFICSFPSSYEDRRHRVMERMNCRKQSEKRCVLIIDDLSTFLASGEENSILLQKLIEKSLSDPVLVILFCGIMQNVPYRMAGMIGQKYVLQCDKVQEVQAVLECSGHHIQKKKGFGLMKKETVMEFRYLVCTDSEIRTFSDACVKKYGTEKSYCIPCMPEKISVCHYHGVRIPLGLRIRDFSWCTISPVETVSVIAMYPEDLERMQRILSPYGKCRFPEDTDAEDAQVLLMDFDYWMRVQPQTEAVLLIGETFRQQFVYRCRRKSIKENEALFCHDHEREVIRIVEE